MEKKEKNTKPTDNTEENKSEKKAAGTVKKGKEKPGLVTTLIRVAVIVFFLVALGTLSGTMYEYLHDVEISNNLRNEILSPDNENTSNTSLRPNRETPLYPGKMSPVVVYPDIISREKIIALSQANKEAKLKFRLNEVESQLAAGTITADAAAEKNELFNKTTESDFKYWFYIEGTDVSYPVLFSGDNSFYLKRDFYCADNISGSLFLDFRSTDLVGHTIIYGHNMKNGTMFGKLRDYNDEVFFRHHTMIYLYDENEITAWQIFSAYPTNIFNNYTKSTFSSSQDYLKFIQGFQKASLYKTDIELKETDDVLTLSTCRNGEGNNGRFVVHAVKVYTFARN